MKLKWINAIKCKDFISGEHHCVCSLHFQGGKKMGMTDVPAIFPLLPQPKLRKPPRERELLPNPAKRRCTLLVNPVENAVVGEDDEDERIKMQQEVDQLRNWSGYKLRSLAFSDLLAVIVTFDFTLGFLTTTL